MANPSECVEGGSTVRYKEICWGEADVCEAWIFEALSKLEKARSVSLTDGTNSEPLYFDVYDISVRLVGGEDDGIWRFGPRPLNTREMKALIAADVENVRKVMGEYDGPTVREWGWFVTDSSAVDWEALRRDERNIKQGHLPVGGTYFMSSKELAQHLCAAEKKARRSKWGSVEYIDLEAKAEVELRQVAQLGYLGSDEELETVPVGVQDDQGRSLVLPWKLTSFSSAYSPQAMEVTVRFMATSTTDANTEELELESESGQDNGFD